MGDEDDSVVKSSQDVDTTILFTKPIPSYGDATFGEWLMKVVLLEAPISFTCSLINLQ